MARPKESPMQFHYDAAADRFLDALYFLRSERGQRWLLLVQLMEGRC